jgi:hypothetical protein
MSAYDPHDLYRTAEHPVEFTRDPNVLLTGHDAAVLLGMRPETLIEWRRQRVGPPVIELPGTGRWRTMNEVGNLTARYRYGDLVAFIWHMRRLMDRPPARPAAEPVVQPPEPDRSPVRKLSRRPWLPPARDRTTGPAVAALRTEPQPEFHEFIAAVLRDAKNSGNAQTGLTARDITMWLQAGTNCADLFRNTLTPASVIACMRKHGDWFVPPATGAAARGSGAWTLTSDGEAGLRRRKPSGRKPPTEQVLAERRMMATRAKRGPNAGSGSSVTG